MPSSFTATMILILAGEAVRQWRRANSRRRRMLLVLALVAVMLGIPSSPPPHHEPQGREPPLAAARPDGGGADAAPARAPERGQLLADQPAFAGEPLAEGCTPGADPLAAQCHIGVGRP